MMEINVFVMGKLGTNDKGGYFIPKVNKAKV